MKLSPKNLLYQLVIELTNQAKSIVVDAYICDNLNTKYYNYFINIIDEYYNSVVTLGNYSIYSNFVMRTQEMVDSLRTTLLSCPNPKYREGIGYNTMMKIYNLFNSYYYTFVCRNNSR